MSQESHPHGVVVNVLTSKAVCCGSESNFGLDCFLKSNWSFEYFALLAREIKLSVTTATINTFVNEVFQHYHHYYVQI